MEIQDKIKQYLGEDATDQEKHNKLNDIFQSLERLNDEVYELEYLDAQEGASGVGDLNDQLVTFRKLIKGLYSVLDRASGVVPKEAQEGEVNEYRMSYGDADKLGRENASKIDNILRRKVADSGKDIRDVEMGDLEVMRYKIAKNLGLVEADEIIQSIPSKTVKLAGDSIWDRDGENPESVQVSNVTIENPYEPGGYMDDDEDDGYRKVNVEHDGPWTIYTDSGFEAAISKMVGFKVVFTEQGMQEDGMASMEGGSEGFDEAKNTPVSDDINRLKQLAGV